MRLSLSSRSSGFNGFSGCKQVESMQGVIERFSIRSARSRYGVTELFYTSMMLRHSHSDLFAKFGSPIQHSNITVNRPMHIGFSTAVLETAWASKPVMNGANAPPDDPALAMNEYAVICMSIGKRAVNMNDEQG